MTTVTTQTAPYHPDDIVVWPDGFWAPFEEVRNGEYSHRSDDFEIVRLEGHARLKGLGVADEPGIP